MKSSEELDRRRAFIAHAAAHRQHHAGNDQHGGYVEAVEEQKAEDRIGRKGDGRETEDIDLILMDVRRSGVKREPAKHQGEGDQNRQDAAPHDQPVRGPAAASAREDEVVEDELADDALNPYAHVAYNMPAHQEGLPAAPPVQAGGRPLQPNRIAIGDAADGEEGGKGISDERGIKVREVARTNHDQDSRQTGNERRPAQRFHGFPFHLRTSCWPQGSA